MVAAVVRRRSTDALPWAVLVMLVVLDTISTRIVVSGAYPIAAVVASTMTDVRRTTWVAAASVSFTGVSMLWNDYMGTADYGLRLAVSGVLGAVAVVAARIRVGREQALAAMTMIAEKFQQAVLRSIPADVGTVGFATQYRSAAREALVGGDLFEVVDTAHGVRVILGDVRGKGIDGVQLAATVLAAFRRAALAKAELTDVADEIDKVVQAVAGDEDFVTALLCQFSPGGAMTIVNRGHHPPLLLRASGAASYLDTGDPQPPLGLGTGTSTGAEVTWPTHARLLLYTDGLVEARNEEGTFFPLESWAHHLVQGDLEAALARLLVRVEEFIDHEVTDDIALLLAENRDSGSPRPDGARGRVDRERGPLDLERSRGSFEPGQ